MNQIFENQHDSQRLRQLAWRIWSTGSGKTTRKTRGTSGFTLTEVLIVIVIAGVLAAIAAPGWLAFMNRQRLGTAQTELLQLLREAQKQSINNRTTYGIEIQDDKRTIRKFTTKDAGADEIRYTGAKFVVGSGDNNSLRVETSDDNRDRISFNFDGSVMNGTTKLIVTSTDQPDAPRCVIIETILGAMREGSGGECLN